MEVSSLPLVKGRSLLPRVLVLSPLLSLSDCVLKDHIHMKSGSESAQPEEFSQSQ